MHQFSDVPGERKILNITMLYTLLFVFDNKKNSEMKHLISCKFNQMSTCK